MFKLEERIWLWILVFLMFELYIIDSVLCNYKLMFKIDVGNKKFLYIVYCVFKNFGWFCFMICLNYVELCYFV